MQLHAHARARSGEPFRLSGNLGIVEQMPRDLVFVLVGEELVEVAGDGERQRGGRGGDRPLARRDVGDEVDVAGRVRAILIADEVGREPRDGLGDLGGRGESRRSAPGARDRAGAWRRRRASRARARRAPRRRSRDGRAGTPACSSRRRPVERDRLLDRAGSIGSAPACTAMPTTKKLAVTASPNARVVMARRVGPVAVAAARDLARRASRSAEHGIGVSGCVIIAPVGVGELEPTTTVRSGVRPAACLSATRRPAGRTRAGGRPGPRRAGSLGVTWSQVRRRSLTTGPAFCESPIWSRPRTA